MFSAKKWCIGFIGLCLSAFIIMSLVVYFYDPYCYYRIPDNRLIINNYRFLNPGIAKNADYNTVIVGSSMIQNFKMDSFRKKLHLNPIKLSIGGMSIQGMDLTLSQVYSIDKAENVFICIDLPSLNKETDNLEIYATYLYNENPFDDYKYLLGYETWMRLLPLNFGFDMLLKSPFEKSIPQFYGTYNIDTIGEWEKDSVFEKEQVVNDYLENVNQISQQSTVGIYERMTANADTLIEILNRNPNVKITAFFPPYSALMWYHSQEQGYYHVYQNVKKYIVDQFSLSDNIRIFDFQCMPVICDLDNYKDTTHYSGRINEMMVDCFASYEYSVSDETLLESINSLDRLVEQFKRDNSDWLNYSADE